MLKLMRMQTKNGRKRTEGVDSTFMAGELLLFFSELKLFFRAKLKAVDEPEERHNTGPLSHVRGYTLADLCLEVFRNSGTLFLRGHFVKLKVATLRHSDWIRSRLMNFNFCQESVP
jgi:hypothetical protein